MYRKAGIGKTIERALKNVKKHHGLTKIEDYEELIVPDDMSASQLEQRLFFACCAYNNSKRELTITEHNALEWFRKYFADWEIYVSVFKYSSSTTIAIKDLNCYRFVGMNGRATPQ
jgi:hypothetical protein